MPPGSRITDMHTCPMTTGPVPHVGGPIVMPSAPTVLIGCLPVAGLGSMAICVGPPDTVIKGSLTVLIGNKPTARMGDQTGHGGVVIGCCPTVMIGG
ncbi:MAG TPA: PAAR domain-containing protein [Victivallales bacterium]|nr:PAAR domain-containing protein [Victivallales bacterium]